MRGRFRPATLAAAMLATVLTALLLAAPAAGGPVKEVATGGAVRAELSYAKVSDTEVRDLRLKIVRAGTTVLDGRLRLNCLDCGVVPLKVVGLTSLRVRDLDGDREPEVLVGLYTGGAHCCFVTAFYRYDSSGPLYARSEHDFGDAGFTLRDLDGDRVPELESADVAFAYAFTSFADSVFPSQIWRYRQGRLTDVTRSFPKLIAAEVDALWRGYRRARGEEGSDVRGTLAAWAGDMDLLGRGAEVWPKLEQARLRGDLDGPGPWPAGKKYVSVLRAFLKDAGYRR